MSFINHPKRTINTLLFLLCIAISIAGCANVVAPTGGAGIKTLPFVTQASIPNGQINFSGNNIELTFNSYMNRSVVIENLSITPSTKYTHKWSGKTLKIFFLEELLPQTTYSIILSGQFSDHYENIADSGFYTVFSTGNIIDSGKIQGNIYSDKTDGYYVFCYTLNTNQNQDTINYLTQVANYKVLVGSNGTFTIPALKDGTYRVVAVQDVDKDGIITHTRDTIGISYCDAIIENGGTAVVNIIPNGIADTLSPELTACTAINSNEILLTFNEPITLDALDANCFYLVNNSNENLIGTTYFYDKNKNKELKLYFENAINKDSIWHLAFDSNGVGAIKDGNENKFNLIKNVELLNETDSIYFPEEVQVAKDSAEATNLKLSGIVKDSNKFEGNSDLIANRYLIITNIQNNQKHSTKINSDNTFQFEKIVAGEYKVFYFCDINNNEKYDYGKLIPFEFAEPFVVIEKNIVLKPKWSIDNYELQPRLPYVPSLFAPTLKE